MIIPSHACPVSSSSHTLGHALPNCSRKKGERPSVATILGRRLKVRVQPQRSNLLRDLQVILHSRIRLAVLLRNSSHSLEIAHSSVNSRIGHAGTLRLILELRHRQSNALPVVCVLCLVLGFLFWREESFALLVTQTLALVLLFHSETIGWLVDLLEVVADRG